MNETEIAALAFKTLCSSIDPTKGHEIVYNIVRERYPHLPAYNSLPVYLMQMMILFGFETIDRAISSLLHLMFVSKSVVPHEELKTLPAESCATRLKDAWLELKRNNLA